MNIESVRGEDLSGLFGFVDDRFRAFTRELARYGAPSYPDLELRLGTGLLCYYDLETRQISLSFPDPHDPVGRIQFLFMRELLGFADNDELARFMFLLMPRLLAHEMGHCYRHRCGRFGDDLWMEEQIANQCANAMTKHRYRPLEAHLLCAYLARAVGRLSRKMASNESALGAYYSPLHALNVAGSLSSGVMDNLQVVEKLFAIDPRDLLRRMESIAREHRELLERREDLIADFNRQYSSDLVRYLFYQLTWTLLDLQSRELHYVDHVVRHHLQAPDEALAPPSNSLPAGDAVVALYRCHTTAAPRSEAISRYFFKRYRSMLLAFVLQSGAGRGDAAPLERREVRMLIEGWDEKDFDILDYVEQMVAPEMRRFFPPALNAAPSGPVDPDLAALGDTDLRILRHILLGTPDAPARRTVDCLATLDRIEGFRALPADILVELAAAFCHLKCDAGETVIWEGSNNSDVFILVSGGLDVLVSRDGTETVIGAVRPGEVFGEMAFLTGEARSATVRAVVDSECLVVRAADLRVFIAREPAILVQMAKVLARRLRAMDRTGGAATSSSL